MNKIKRAGPFVLVALVASSCGSPDVSIGCMLEGAEEVLSLRTSPFDSAVVRLGDTVGQVCYSRPFTRGREIFGGIISYDTLWRTGANEATVIRLPVATELAGLALEPGAYSLYTVPSETQWQVVVNGSSTHWGITQREVGAAGNVFESAYVGEVRAQEIGRAPVETRAIEPVGQLTVRDSVTDAGTDILIEWSTTQIVIPIRRISGTN